MNASPLLVLDTNLLIDVWLGRRQEAALLVKLAEAQRVEIQVPEVVLSEFRGRALRLVHDTEVQLDRQVRPIVKEMSRYQAMGAATSAMKQGTDEAVRELAALGSAIDPVITQLKRTCAIIIHKPDVHLRGELRYLAGKPPDRPVDGLVDCRIFECVLEIAREDAVSPRTKRFFVSTDSDFGHPDLHAELAQYGFMLRRDIGALYGELK